LAAVLVAGLDSRGLLLEAPLLQREGCVVEERSSARAILQDIATRRTRLVVLGPLIDGPPLPEVVRRIRSSPTLRGVSILALLPTSEPASVDQTLVAAGANAVLRRPLERRQLEGWIAKLLTVAHRVGVRIPVDGQVVGSPRSSPSGHFCGIARNLSAHGLLLACPVRLDPSMDLELDLRLSRGPMQLKLLGRVVREAPDVHWPYLGYGIEFLWTPGVSMAAIERVVETETARTEASPESGVHSTLRRGSWVYEVRQPAPCPDGWQVEIWRAPADAWRPSSAGPFFVVAAPSPTEALSRARDFLDRNG
jgi:CheY-like chemotaxis protein